MARLPSFSPTPEILAEAVERLTKGQKADNILIALRGAFPGTPLETLRGNIAHAVESVGGATVLRKANRGLATPAAKLLGCWDPDAEVRVSVVVRALDLTTGRVKRWFADAVHLDKRGRLGAVLDNAAASVIANMQAAGYDVRTFRSNIVAPDHSFSILTAECV